MNEIQLRLRTVQLINAWSYSDLDLFVIFYLHLIYLFNFGYITEDGTAS